MGHWIFICPQRSLSPQALIIDEYRRKNCIQNLFILFKIHQKMFWRPPKGFQNNPSCKKLKSGQIYAVNTARFLKYVRRFSILCKEGLKQKCWEGILAQFLCYIVAGMKMLNQNLRFRYFLPFRDVLFLEQSQGMILTSINWLEPQ